MFLDLATDKSQKEHARRRPESFLQVAYDALDKAFFDTLYQSMGDRTETCITADGWHTKY
jgi:hypothetical protein